MICKDETIPLIQLDQFSICPINNLPEQAPKLRSNKPITNIPLIFLIVFPFDSSFNHSCHSSN